MWAQMHISLPFQTILILSKFLLPLGGPSLLLWLSLPVDELMNEVGVSDFNSPCVEALGILVWGLVEAPSRDPCHLVWFISKAA